MDNNDEVVATGAVRRTRSGRTVRSPATAVAVAPKPIVRKKKKVVMVEVEVSDEEEIREEGDNSHNDNQKEETDEQTELSPVELESSDNAVEASEQFTKTNDHSSDFDNCSNTAQFPEKSNINSVIDHEINSFKGAITTYEDVPDVSMELVEITPTELPNSLPRDDTEDAQQIHECSTTEQSNVDIVDELLAGGDSFTEADSLPSDLIGGGDSVTDPLKEDIVFGADSLSNLDTQIEGENSDITRVTEHMDSNDAAVTLDANVLAGTGNITNDAAVTMDTNDSEIAVCTINDVAVPMDTSNAPVMDIGGDITRVNDEKQGSAGYGTMLLTIKKLADMKPKSDNGEPDTEVISEDELPEVQVAKVPETEEVSDEELPGPKRAELPADTEVVSEDELPTVKKEGTKRKLTEGDYDPGSPTSESENPTKKPALETETEKEKEDKTKPKKLPELDKYWKAVNDDPSDFTGWTYLLQYVDQENDMEAAREAYDAFLSHYPYCYGYWRKYADYEKRKGNKKKCEEVFERGLKAIPLSVDLWIHYLTYVRTSRPEDEDFIRVQFERALTACGLEFRSDRLWDSYIKWETEAKRLQHVTALYDRLLATPTQGYTSHFDNFQEHVASHLPNKILEVDEFLALRKEVKQLLKQDAAKAESDSESTTTDVPPGEDDDKETVSSDEEVKGIRERIVSIRRKIHKNTVNAVTSRWNFEEGIKRPYFHVKPLERCQLKNWQDYLDFEIEQGEQSRITVLFERCLIACALYEEFWLRYVLYLEALKDPELLPKIKDAYERACTIHHLKKPNLHTQWAIFEESIQNYDRAAEILVNLEKSVPNLLQVAFRRINLERRRGDNEKCCQLYEHYISNVKNKIIASNLSIKFARYCHKIMKNAEKAVEILQGAVSKDPNNPRLYLQLIDLLLQKQDTTESDILSHMDTFLQKDGIENEQKLLFAQRKLEYLEDFGCSVQGLQKAQEEYQKYLKLIKESVPKKKDITKQDIVPTSKKDKNPPLPSSQSNSYGNYGNYSNSTNSATNYNQYQASQQGQYNYPQYGQGDQYNYQNWQYSQGGYGGYNQWGGYGGGYSY